MCKMSKEKITLPSNSKLICVTGFMGSGKTTVMHIIKQLGYKTFITDEFVHSIYMNGNIGYEIIKKNFGIEFVTNNSVDREKLRNLIINNSNKKALLEKLMNKVIYDKIFSLQKENDLIFVELGTYLFFEEYFKNLFKKVVVIDSLDKNFKKNNFKKFSHIEKFSTKPVGNFKNPQKTRVFYADFIVENDGNLLDLEIKVKDLIKFFDHI